MMSKTLYIKLIIAYIRQAMYIVLWGFGYPQYVV